MCGNFKSFLGISQQPVAIYRFEHMYVEQVYVERMFDRSAGRP